MFSRRLSVALALALCCFAGGIVWSRRAVPSTQPKQNAKSPFPSRELEELDRVVQARFAVIPSDGSFGYSRIAIRQLHGHFYATSKEEVSAVAALGRANQQVAFYLVGREKFVGRRNAVGRLQGPLLLTAPASWNTKVGMRQVEAEYKNFSASAPSQFQLQALADSVYAQSNPKDGNQTRVEEWHIVARPVEASAERCVTCHNAMAKKPPSQPVLLWHNPTLFRCTIRLGSRSTVFAPLPKLRRSGNNKVRDSYPRCARSISILTWPLRVYCLPSLSVTRVIL